MKKHSKVLIALAVIASMFTVTAYAKDIKFSITKSDGATAITTNTKDRTQNSWLITNSDTSYSNFIAGEDVIGFRVRNTSKTAMSSYHTFTNFVKNYALPYTKTPTQGQTLVLWSQIDSTGDYSIINFEGKWFT